MIQKKNILNKLVKKDYNNELEKILEEKNFDENVKSILLSILYKIEASYKDFETVKKDVQTEEEYISNIIRIIKEQCDCIKILNMTDKKSEIPKNKTYIINKEKKEIIAYPIERKILYSIAKMATKDTIIKDEYYLINETLSELINVGNCISMVEPLRDFNGYSWTTIPQEIESIEHNLIYQNLRMLVGDKMLNKWVKNSEFMIDYYEQFKDELEKNYGKDNMKKIIDKLSKISILFSYKYNRDKMQKFIDEKEKVKAELDEIKDRQNFVEQKTKEKREITSKIKEIDKIINNKKLLEQEYNTRNEKLSLQKKIFSMKILAKMMVKEKEEYLKQLEDLNKVLNPKEFIKYKKGLEEKYNYLKLFDLNDKEKELDKLKIEFQKLFIKLFEINLNKALTKQEIEKLMYNFRYYLLLPYDYQNNIQNINKLQNELNNVSNLLINKLIQLKVLENISKDEEKNHETLKNIFSTRLIKLEDSYVQMGRFYLDKSVYKEEFMKITFLGATKTVTGSNYLVEAAGKKFLVDCGLWQGRKELEEENFEDFEFNPAEIDFVLLTHAHIDHSGRIPKLYKEGFRNKVYAHKATCDLCALMLPDSGHIQEMENEWKNRKRMRKGLPEREPLYTAEQAVRCLEIFEAVKYDEIVEITPEIHVRFNDAGHMLGSSIIELWVNEDGKQTKTVFTGDLGNNDIPLLSEPTMIDDADYLIMESTYGSRVHEKNEVKAEMFLDIVSETIEKGGTVVIPSFAVGRTQEILYELNKIKETRDDEKFIREYETLMKAPVYVDSPLAISATEVFKENMDLFDDQTQEEMEKGDKPLEFPGLKFTVTAEESKALNASAEPSIIISASGMCEVGRIKHHLKHNLWNPNSTILFVGYQAPGTLGYSIVNGAKKVKIFGEEIAVNARIEYLEGYSGHADQNGLMNFIYSFIKKPKQIFLVHGEEESQEILKDKIETETNLKVSIADFGETYEFGDEQAKLLTKIDRELAIDNRKEVLNRLEKLKDEIIDMETSVREDMDNKALRNEDIFRINEKIKELEKQILSVIEG